MAKDVVTGTVRARGVARAYCYNPDTRLISYKPGPGDKPKHLARLPADEAKKSKISEKAIRKAIEATLDSYDAAAAAPKAPSDNAGRRASARNAAADVPPVAPAASTSDALDYYALGTLARGGGASSTKDFAAKVKEALARPEIGIQTTGNTANDRRALKKWLEENEPPVDSSGLSSKTGFVRTVAPDWTADEDAKLCVAFELHGSSDADAGEKLAEAVGTRDAAQCISRTRRMGLREPAAIMVYEYDAEEPTKHAISVMGDATPVSARVARAAFAAMDVELLERHVEGVWSSLGPSLRSPSSGKLVDILVAARVIPKYYEKGGSMTLRWTKRVRDTQTLARQKAAGVKRSRQAAADALRFDGGAPQPRVNSEKAHYGRLRKLKALLLALKAGASKNELPTSAELPELFRGLRFPSFEDKPAGTYDEAQQCYICRVLYLLKGGRVIVEHAHKPDDTQEHNVHARCLGTCQKCNTSWLAEIDFWLDVLGLTLQGAEELAEAFVSRFGYELKPAFEA